MRDLQAARGTSISSPAVPAPTGSRLRLRLLYAGVALAGLALDVVTKVLAVARLDPNDPPELLGGLLRLRLIRNPGAAFSQGEGLTPLFALAAIAVLIFVLVRLVPRVGHRGWAVALGLLTAGVAGNLVDRIFRQPGVLHGHVVDFLQLPYWPIFNVADICICAAAGFIVVLGMIKNLSLSGVPHPSGPARPRREPDPAP